MAILGNPTTVNISTPSYNSNYNYGLLTSLTGHCTTNINIGTTLPNYSNYGSTISSTYWQPEKVSKLKDLKYTAEFFVNDKNKKHLLEDNISCLRKNKIFFNCDFDGNRIQPYEFIMKLIEDEEKFNVKIVISDILTVCYTDFQFIEIINNFNFDETCDFSELKVKFKYDKMLYENNKLSIKESRSDKLKKIIKNI